MRVAERTYLCVGGPFDGLEYTLQGQNRVSLATALKFPLQSGMPEPAGPVFDYDVRRLLAPDGRWYEFLVLSAWTGMQATVWINRRPSKR